MRRRRRVAVETRPAHRVRPRGVVPAGTLISVAMAVTSCSGATPSAGPHGGGTAQPGTTTPAPASTTPATTTPAGPAVPVTDAAGQTFTVRATTVSSPLVVDVRGSFRSASPGHVFLQQGVTVVNVGHAAASLQAFDDPATGSAGDVQFVMDAAEAAKSGYGSDCGVAARYPAQLCPISYPQGVVVVSDSADPSGGAVTLAPGASAEIVYSFGPVLASLGRSQVRLYFSGPSGPQDLGR